MAKKKSKEELDIDDSLDLNDEEESSGGNKLLNAFIVVVVIAIWLVIFGLLIKMNVGGIGSMLRPFLKNVPVINRILPEATDEEIIHACELAQADPFVQTFPKKYNTYIEQGGSNVSGGQKQRLCIARALLKKPKILILDDSTSAVDTATDAKIREAFAKEIPDTTKLIIAQRVSSIQSADRIIVMDNGEISGFDTHENLMKSNEIYRDVYESQTKGGGDFDENGGE